MRTLRGTVSRTLASPCAASAVFRTEQKAVATDHGHRHTRILAPTVELEPGLALPAPQDLLLSGALNVVEDDRGARRQPIMQDGQRRVAGQPVPGGIRRWAVHEQKVDEVAP